MSENQFSEVIASAQQSASERKAKIAAHRETYSESLKTKHEVLHTVISRTLLQAWKDLEAAGVQASIETDSTSHGDWRISLGIPSKPFKGKLVFSVRTALVPHLGYSVIPQGPVDEIEFNQISDDVTPVEVAQIVAGYLSNTLG
ncbi:hypothetical protein [Luteolibacter luteus]|uniref:Uncharacterized protein n=1 Tax=Luteolibacter luteus TaxID=2728835 RepID=A0A858RH13_9BACT|nr:hypothetical protein [Luteolibacter luteus]QJE95995.1 hypothetical protein HHL09_09435 [Luteolibacter luteus]